jgi:hypothetical protein
MPPTPVKRSPSLAVALGGEQRGDRHLLGEMPDYAPDQLMLHLIERIYSVRF